MLEETIRIQQETIARLESENEHLAQEVRDLKNRVAELEGSGGILMTGLLSM
jgi:hypothetical protein